MKLQAEYAERSDSGELRRSQHAKTHLGITNARFEVSADLPHHLQAGLFRAGAEYAAIVRFSNASGRILPDHERDLRGIAVRVTSAPDRHNDFIATNYPRNELHPKRYPTPSSA